MHLLKWSLRINVAKTKICVFEEGKQAHKEEFFISNQIVEFVDQFTYLGVIFSHTGKLR